MNNEEVIELLKEMKANCIKGMMKGAIYTDEKAEKKAIAIDTVLIYIEELENKLKIQTENYNSAMEDINYFCGKRTGKTVETALILRKEILKLPESRTYGIRRCKKNIICIIPEEVTLNSKIRDKIKELEPIIEKYEKQMENDEDTDLSYEEIRNYACRMQAYKELLEEEK